MPKIKVALLILTLTMVLPCKQVLAEDLGMARGTATSLQIVTEDAKPGSIVTHKNEEFTLAKESFDTEILV